MDRRDFIKTTGTLIARTSFVPHLVADAAGDSTGQGRMVLPMNRNWRYSQKVAEARHTKDFDESDFDRIVLPHTNIRLPWHGFDEKKYEFVSIYRRRFRVPKAARG